MYVYIYVSMYIYKHKIVLIVQPQIIVFWVFLWLAICFYFWLNCDAVFSFPLFMAKFCILPFPEYLHVNKSERQQQQQQKKSPKHPYKQSCSRVISLVSDRVLEALNKVLVAIHCLKSQKKKLQSSEMTG